MNFIKKNGAGLLLCLIIAIPAWFLGQAVPVIGGPVFSILIGMVITLFPHKKRPLYSRDQFHIEKNTPGCCRVPRIRHEPDRDPGKGEAVAPHHPGHDLNLSRIIAFFLYKALKLRIQQCGPGGGGLLDLRRGARSQRQPRSSMPQMRRSRSRSP